jgi:hypothetical protein
VDERDKRQEDLDAKPKIQDSLWGGLFNLIYEIVVAPKNLKQWFLTLSLLTAVGFWVTVVGVVIQSPGSLTNFLSQKPATFTPNVSKEALDLMRQTLDSFELEGYGIVSYSKKSGLKSLVGGIDPSGAIIKKGDVGTSLATPFGQYASLFHRARSCFSGNPHEWDKSVQNRYVVTTCPIFSRNTLVAYAFTVSLKEKATSNLLLALSDLTQEIQGRFFP